MTDATPNEWLPIETAPLDKTIEVMISEIGPPILAICWIGEDKKRHWCIQGGTIVKNLESILKGWRNILTDGE